MSRTAIGDNPRPICLSLTSPKLHLATFKKIQEEVCLGNSKRKHAVSHSGFLKSIFSEQSVGYTLSEGGGGGGVLPYMGY